MEENLSSTSFVSTISAASSVHQPRPPDGPKPPKQPFQTRKTKAVRSPYLATSTPYLPPKRRRGDGGGALGSKSAPHVTRERWTSAVRASGYIPEAWAPPPLPSSHPHPSSSSSSFLHTLMTTPGFSAVVTATVSRKRARNSTGTGPAPGGEEERDARDLRDEITELKKTINVLSRERDSAKTRVRRLEGEVGRRDKQIEDLLATGHIPSRDATRSLASVGNRRSDSGGGPALISSLRQQVHILERALREKEAAYSTLQRKNTATRVRELEVEGETYYQEVHRLTQLLQQQQLSGRGPGLLRETEVRARALSEAVERLSRQVEEAERENRELRGRLENSRPPVESSHSEQGLRGSIADKYADYNRTQMLSALVDMEMKAQERERALQSVCREMEEKRAHSERRLGALAGEKRDVFTQVEQLQGRLSELEAQREKLRGVVRKLKEDRTHYRSLAEQTQSELQDVRELLSSEEVRSGEVGRELDALREKHQNEILAREHAQKLASRRSQLISPVSQREETAAVAIQHHWRRTQAIRKQHRFQEERETTAINIQSALRAHVARKKQLEVSSPSPSLTPSHSHSTLAHSEDEEESGDLVAIETVQSALRGYFTRQMALQDLLSPAADSVEESGTSATNLDDQSQPASDKDSVRAGKPSRSELWRTGITKNGSVEYGNVPREFSLVGYQPPRRREEVSHNQVLGRAVRRKERRPRGSQRHYGSDSPWAHVHRGVASSGSEGGSEGEGRGGERAKENSHMPHRARSRATPVHTSNESEQTSGDIVEKSFLADELV